MAKLDDGFYDKIDLRIKQPVKNFISLVSVRSSRTIRRIGVAISKPKLKLYNEPNIRHPFKSTLRYN